MSNKVTLAAGAEATLSLHGFGFYVVKSDGPVIVELREIDGSQDEAGILEAGQGLQGSSRFEAVRIINMHTTTQTIEFYVGPRTFVDNRNVGVVEVSGTVKVDQVPSPEKNRFTIYQGNAVPASRYLYSAIENPVGSGKKVAIYKAWIACDKTGIYRVARNNVHPSVQLYGNGVGVIEQLSGSEPSVVVGKVGSVSSGPAVSTWPFTGHLTANNNLVSPLETPIVLEEGDIAFWYSDSTGAMIAFPSFEWEEY